MRYACHDCGMAFESAFERDGGVYRFQRCPNCASAKTTLASEADSDDGDSDPRD